MTSKANEGKANQSDISEWGGSLNVNEMRTNDLLRKDEWESLDSAVQRVSRRSLKAISDIRDAGLTRDLGGLGTIFAQYERLGKMGSAEQSLGGETSSEEDTQDYTLDQVPVPITHKDFRFNRRRLESSRNRGESLDTTGPQEASRLVSEKLEDMLFNGGDITVEGDGIEGFTTESNRLTVTLSNNWDTSSGTPLTDVLDMVESANENGFEGPYHLYYSSNYESVVQDDYKSESERTLMDRLMDISGIENVRSSAKLSDDNVVLVQMTQDVVELGVAQDVTTVQWESGSGMSVHYKVMSAIAPIIKDKTIDTSSSSNDVASGIVHLS